MGPKRPTQIPHWYAHKELIRAPRDLRKSHPDMPTRSPYTRPKRPTQIPHGCTHKEPMRDPRRSHTGPSNAREDTDSCWTYDRVFLLRHRVTLRSVSLNGILKHFRIWNDYCYCDIPIKSVEILFYCNQINSTINRHNGRISLIGKEKPRRDKRNSADKGHLNSL